MRRGLPRTPRGWRAPRALLTLLALLGAPPGAAQGPGEAPPGPARVDGARILGADAEPWNWLAHGRTWSEQRYSPLDQIRRENVARLGLAWAYPTGTRRGLEATPLVVDGVLYATATWSVVFALDAATGRELWRYDPRVPGGTARKACCDVVNRGVALWKGRVYVGTLDGRLVALDARSGEPVWEVKTVDPRLPYTITGAPRVARGMVFIGNGGAEFGVRGYFSAYDAETGRQLWRFYTVPGPPSLPYEHEELEVAARTWSPDSMWEAGLGGTVWDSMAYDPELDLLYVGVGNASPYNRKIRSPGGGDNLFLASILAVDPDTGRLAWHYQTTPGENWDYTATQHMILAELELEGRRRKVLMQAPKNGFFYVLDRTNGELLAADKLVYVNWASHVDMRTGRPVETGRAEWAEEQRFVVPGPPGAHNWHPMSFSPRTGLVYVPTLNNGFPYAPKRDFRFVPGAMNTGEDHSQLVPVARFWTRPCAASHITAWDPVRRRRAWRVTHDHPINGGILSTAGDLVFQGNGSGVFAGYDAEDGRRLWESRVGVGIMAPPVSYAVGGEQYVAVLAGIGGTPALNYLDLPAANEGVLLAYKLGGEAALPRPAPLPEGEVQAPPLAASPEDVARGEALYAVHCARCHGFVVRGNGFLPDLRYSTREVHSRWNDIVLGGTRSARGMASFADLLSPEEAEAIHAYVVKRARHEPGWLDRALDWAGQSLCVPLPWVAD